MKVNFRSFSFLFLLLIVSGCLPAGGGAGSAGGISNPAEPTAIGSRGGTGVPDQTPPLAANADVLGPRVDSERVSEDTLIVDARYGVQMSQTVSLQGTANLKLPASGLLDWPVFVSIAFRAADDHSGFDWLNTGVQVRILENYRDTTGTIRYRYCDVITGSVQPDGSNATFSGLNLLGGGQLTMFIIDPRKSSVPTGDFSAGLIDVPATTSFEAFTRDNLLVGTIQLVVAFDATIPLGDGVGTGGGGSGVYEIIPDAPPQTQPAVSMPEPLWLFP